MASYIEFSDHVFYCIISGFIGVSIGAFVVCVVWSWTDRRKWESDRKLFREAKRAQEHCGLLITKWPHGHPMPSIDHIYDKKEE